MSQENVEVVVGYFEAEDLPSSVCALAEDVIFVFHGEVRHLAGAETLVGKQAAVDWLRDWFSRFELDYRLEVQEARASGERVLVVHTHRARGRVSGAPISQQTASVLTVRESKIVRHDFFGSRDEALEAAGLGE